MMKIDLLKVTKKELVELDYFYPKTSFNEIIIVPTEELHESSFRCMKFVLLNRDSEVAGVVSGYSDIIHLNGIGGYGRDYKSALATGKVDRVGWSIDCLPCGLLRLFTFDNLTIDNFIGSDFCIYPENKPATKEVWEWKKVKNYPNLVICGNCGEPFEISSPLDLWNYCPNCGMRMEIK